MLSQQKVLASHAREDQSSSAVFAARKAHWKKIQISLEVARNACNPVATRVGGVQ